MFRECTLGRGFSRPSIFAACVKQGASCQDYRPLAYVRPLHNHRVHVRLQNSHGASGPAQGSPDKPVSPSVPEAPAVRAFFNRQHELGYLRGLLNTEPVAITVLVGPPSSGKTALMQHYIQQLEADRAAQPVYINCRRYDVQTPDAFVEALLSITCSMTERLPAFVGNFLTAVAEMLSHKFKFGDTDMTDRLKALPMLEVVEAFAAMSGTSALARVLHLFAQGLADSEEQELSAQTDHWPAIIIDEANALTSWTNTHPRELRTLLRFFVLVAKERNAAHVLLLTSEFSFTDWLSEQGIDRTFYRVQVIGDFRIEEARKFYDMLVGRACSDDDWRQVHEVCGGNAGLLKSAAVDSHRMPLSWALSDIRKTVRPKVESGLHPRAEDIWTQAAYAAVVRGLLAAPEHAVTADAVVAAFGGGRAGRDVLEAMVRVNLLACRPVSYWARDIERSAFEDVDILITAPSPAHLECMRKLQLPKFLPLRVRM